MRITTSKGQYKFHADTPTEEKLIRHADNWNDFLDFMGDKLGFDEDGRKLEDVWGFIATRVREDMEEADDDIL